MRISKEANRPFPTVSNDDVLDFMVTEAVVLKVAEEDKKAAAKEERERWKKERSETLESMR